MLPLMPACCRSADLLFVYLCTLIKHRVIDFEKQPSPPPHDLFFALIQNPLTVFHILNVSEHIRKKNFKKNVCWAHSDPCIYCDDTDCYKLFPAIIPLHIELMDMGPTCSVTSGDMCSVSLPAPALCCVLSALLTLCQISKRWLGRCWARD